jgi:hypothetical protein
MCPHGRKCDDGRDIREGILRALRGMALPMRIRHPEAGGCSGFVRLAYIPVRSMSGPQRVQYRYRDTFERGGRPPVYSRVNSIGLGTQRFGLLVRDGVPIRVLGAHHPGGGNHPGAAARYQQHRSGGSSARHPGTILRRSLSSRRQARSGDHQIRYQFLALGFRGK